MEVEDVALRDTLERGEEVARPSAIGADRERLPAVRVHGETIRKEKAGKRAVVPELLEKARERLPGIEEGVAARDEQSNGFRAIAQVRHRAASGRVSSFSIRSRKPKLEARGVEPLS